MDEKAGLSIDDGRMCAIRSLIFQTLVESIAQLSCFITSPALRKLTFLICLLSSPSPNPPVQHKPQSHLSFKHADLPDPTTKPYPYVKLRA